MKHILLSVALLTATSCVTEGHKQALRANDQLRDQAATMAEQISVLSSQNDQLRREIADLSRRAADASWIAQKQKEIAELLEKYGAGTASAQGGVELVRTAEGYAFRVAGEVLFAPGQNELSASGRRTLTELSAQLKDRSIRIEGHTDDQPIQRSRWGTNRRLSVERALVVADFLVTSAGLPDARVFVAGYGEHRPAVAGNDESSRQKNRRVEILLLEQ